jgi:hypothetical protein
MAHPPTKDEIRADHACTCPTCTPEIAVSSARQGPQHIGVRFWDDNPEESSRQKRAMILLDGVEVTGVFEAVLGEHGTIWRYRGVPSGQYFGRHRCLNCLRKGNGLIEQNGGLFPVDGVPEPQACQEMLAGAVELMARPETL